MATTSGKRRHCTFCTRREDADTCIRSHRSETGEITHVYAHAKCAARRGVSPLYVFLGEGSRSR
ncbi:hypothetical protein [Streptomyces omiyaensis]|uniref:hypothetical protein n=1 Tax=Streptomyces omiyaensis TaxID=68247 RepID=UPI0036FF03F5